MRKWFAFFVVVCGASVALVNAGSAQVQIQVQAQPGQVQQIQIQVQGQAVQVQQIQNQAAARVMLAPALMVPGNRLAQADAVFTGRVVGIEPVDVETPQVPNGPKVTYRIATVMVSEAIFGLKKDAKQVRIGFVVQGNNVPAPVNGPGAGVQILPAIQPLPPGGGFGGPRARFPIQMNLEVGQDGLFSVNKHHKEDFYLAPNFQTFVSRQNNPNFEPSVKTAKQLAKVAGDPLAALKSDSKEDRYTAAAFLITKYRTASNSESKPMKQEQISVEESKLILKALSEGNWKQLAYNLPIPGPLQLFQQLGVNQNDGYNPVNLRTQQEIVESMQKWLDANQGKYRIQRWVIDPNAKAPAIQPGVRPGIQPLPPVRIRPGVQPLPAQPQALPAQSAPANDK